MPMAEGAKYERKYLAHFIDPAFGTPDSATYVRLGKDLEEYAIEMNADVESKTNILGESSTVIKGYTPQGDVEPYYATKGDALFEQLEKIINERLTATQTTVVDVKLDADGKVEWAYRENAVIVPQSIGGQDGIQIPFEIHYVGDRVKGTFDMSSKKFSTEVV